MSKDNKWFRLKKNQKFFAALTHEQLEKFSKLIGGHKYSYSDIVYLYMEFYGDKWAITTQRSRAATLNALAPYFNAGKDRLIKPTELFDYLRGESKTMYSIKSTMYVVTQFMDFAISVGFLPNLLVDGIAMNPFYNFMSNTKARLFRNSYNREQGIMSIEEALTRVNKLPDGPIKEHVLFLLNSGLRLNESYNVQYNADTGTYYVVGKGGKARRVFFNPPETTVEKSRIYTALRKIGLKPHTLRKICATKLVRQGATAPDLLRVMGWSKIDTASYYLQPRTDEQIKELMNNGI